MIKIFAQLENGTAMAETAICTPCMGANAEDVLAAANFVDCTGNDALRCQRCDAGWWGYRIDIPETAWEPNDGIDHPLNALGTDLVINGLPMHLEAWEVFEDDSGDQCAVGDDYRDSFEQLHAAVSADGPMHTIQIRGRNYIIVAHPYC